MSFDPAVIEQSFEKAKPIANDIADKFYEILWTDYPQSKALFDGVDMDKQKRSLIGSLVFIVGHIRDAEKLKTFLVNMGVRHVKYGAKEEHMAWVGASLLKTFAHFFGDKWTDELAANWTAAYGVIAEFMNEGLRRGSSAPAPQAEATLSELAHDLARRLFETALEEEAKGELYALAQAKAEDLLRRSLGDVAKSALSDISSAAHSGNGVDRKALAS